MLITIKAPWTEMQVNFLRGWQTGGDVHPYTCGCHSIGDRELWATAVGWRCRTCDYTQDWAWLPTNLITNDQLRRWVADLSANTDDECRLLHLEPADELLTVINELARRLP